MKPVQTCDLVVLTDATLHIREHHLNPEVLRKDDLRINFQLFKRDPAVLKMNHFIL